MVNYSESAIILLVGTIFRLFKQSKTWDSFGKLFNVRSSSAKDVSELMHFMQMITRAGLHPILLLICTNYFAVRTLVIARVIIINKTKQKGEQKSATGNKGG